MGQKKMGSSRDNRLNLSVFLAVSYGAQEEGNEHMALVSSFLALSPGYPLNLSSTA